MSEHRDESGRLTYDFPDITAVAYADFVDSCVRNFNLQPAGPQTKAVDVVFQDFTSDGCVVGLEWDNWSGFVVVAKTKKSETLAQEVALHINARRDT